MEENIIDKFEEGLSIFTSTGFSWAEDLYQKWENMCQNNIIVQEPAKIVDAINVQVKKIYEEVADDWLSQFSSDHENSLASDSALEQDVMISSFEKSKINHDKESVSEESLMCPISELAIASNEINAVPSSDMHKCERREACNLIFIGCDKAPVSESDVHKGCRPSPYDGPVREGSGSYVYPISALSIAFPLPSIEKNEKKEAAAFIAKENALAAVEDNLCSCSSEMTHSNNENSDLSVSVGLPVSVSASDNICVSTSDSGLLPVTRPDSICLCDFCLGKNVKTDVCEAPRLRHDKELTHEDSLICTLPAHDKELIHEDSLICTLSASTIASEELGAILLPDIDKVESKVACEFVKDAASRESGIVVLPDIDKVESKEACEFVKDVAQSPETNLCDSSRKIKHIDKNLPEFSTCSSTEALENGEEWEPTHFTDPTDDGKSATQDDIYLIEPFSPVHVQRSNSSDMGTSLPIINVGSSDCLSTHRFEYSAMVDALESMEEFEDVSLQDVLDEKTMDEYWKEELTLISHRAMKKRSYKKKLRDVFTSRFYSSNKNKGRAACLSGDLSVDLAKIGITSSPSLVSSRVSEASNFTPEAPESDWELL